MSGHTCCEPMRAIGWGRSYACGAKAKVERDGRWYCLRHDPVARKARADAKDAERRAAQQRLRERLNKSKAEAAEQKRRAECYDDLLAACRTAARYLSPEQFPGAVREVDAAIAKATGGAS